MIRTDRHAGRQADRQTGRPADRQTGRPTDGPTDRTDQTDQTDQTLRLAQPNVHAYGALSTVNPGACPLDPPT